MAQSRQPKGSRNRHKARLLVARLHDRIKQQRQDFLHKLSHQLISENQVVSIEGLRVRNMVKNRHLAKAVCDSGWSELGRQLHYKAHWYGRTVKVIDTFSPTSKTCSVMWVCKQRFEAQPAGLAMPGMSCGAR
jgi:putative transposase